MGPQRSPMPAPHDPDHPPARPANRLAGSTSPYLLQHRHNPVAWQPWDDEAFAEARRRDVPVFLSIGYSTCYWCHVMERESFEHHPTAALMNDLFVCIKLDREERPDLDDLYMAATQIMTGRGGWPMSVFLEPASRRPYFAGTYFPREPRHGLPSFPQVLRGMSQAWQTRRGEVLEQAESLADAVAEHVAQAAQPAAVGEAHVTAAVGTLLQIFDATNGGFGGAPKFPQPVYLEMLLDARAAAGDEATRVAIDKALRHTLDRMAVGGLFDQVGGGFHRYCVDATWTVPHFEKMLYDNAQLLRVYARAAALYRDAWYGRIAERTVEYLQREMTADTGAFFSAQDAEVDHREGLNYLWSPEDAAAELGDAGGPRAAGGPGGLDDRALALSLYGLQHAANFQDPHHPDDPPRHVLRLADRPEALAASLGMSPEALLAALDRVNARLLAARAQRPQPHLDDKHLAAWNGMAIAALADASALLERPAWRTLAARAAGFVLDRMRDDRGRLARSHRAGHDSAPGVLEDDAWAATAFLALHRAGDASRDWLVEARGLIASAARRFGDGRGGLFDTDAEATDLFVRPRTTYDGATPSAAGVFLHALLDLQALLGPHAQGGAGGARAAWDDAVALLRTLSPAIAERGVAAVNSTRALLRMLRSDPSAAEALGGGAVAPPPRTPADDRFTPVEVLADAERLALSEGGVATLALRLRIAPGYHVLSAEPFDEDEARADPALRGLVPLRVGLVSGQGCAVYADYPAGTRQRAGGAATATPRVYERDVEFTVVVEHAPGIGPTPGRPILGVTFQACTDTACLAPRTVELDVAIDLP